MAAYLEPNGSYRTSEVDLGEFACVRNREFARGLANRKCLC
ncbi:MAG: hypothetical protein ABIZ56_08680 [Chthoniobacteraceae bacterium]